jgi:hypothetical protein
MPTLNVHEAKTQLSQLLARHWSADWPWSPDAVFGTLPGLVLLPWR